MVFVSQIRLFYNGQNVSNPADRNLINSIPKKTRNVEVFVKRSAISYAIYYIWLLLSLVEYIIKFYYYSY